MHRVRQYYYFHSSRPSHLLALKLRDSEHFSDIPVTISPQGTLVTDPAQINSIFQQFYAELYQSESQMEYNDHMSYLRTLNLPRLSKEEADMLGKPVTLNELKKALQAMKKGKAPGKIGRAHV